MESTSLIIGLSLAVGMGLVCHVLLSTLWEGGQRLSRRLRRGRLAALGVGHSSEQTQKINEDALFGLDQIPWNKAYLGSTLLGLVLFFVMGPSLPGVRLFFLGLPVLVWLARVYLVQQRKHLMAGAIRQFLIDVRLHMSLKGSLLLGLENLANTTLESTPVHQALKRRLLGGSARSGLDVLRQVADDLNALHLLKAVQRIQSAQQSGGVLDVDQAIASSIEELNEEMTYQAEEQMQHLPLRITLLAMPFLLAPIVILLFYPLVDRILKTLSGVAVGGGF